MRCTCDILILNVHHCSKAIQFWYRYKMILILFYSFSRLLRYISQNRIEMFKTACSVSKSSSHLCKVYFVILCWTTINCLVYFIAFYKTFFGKCIQNTDYSFTTLNSFQVKYVKSYCITRSSLEQSFPCHIQPGQCQTKAKVVCQNGGSLLEFETFPSYRMTKVTSEQTNKSHKRQDKP